MGSSSVEQSSGVEWVTHPLDSLTEYEIRVSREILVAAGIVTEQTRFAIVQIQEPHKSAVLSWSPGQPIERRVFSVLIDSATGAVTEVLTDIGRREVVSQRSLQTDQPPYGQPNFVYADLEIVNEVVRADPQWRAAMALRGITDPMKCLVLPLAPGAFGFPEENGRRVMRAFCLYQEEPTDIPWLRQIDGVIAYVDIVERRIIELFDHGVSPLPARQPGFGEGDWGPTRTTLKPLSITQPAGPSFQVDGAHVTWEKWSFRVGFDAREGLVLHQLGYHDQGRVRPIMYRASLSEMVVPYGDSNPMRFWISYFDEGEYGMGVMAPTLTLGCDCLGAIHYFDATVADQSGNPRVLKRVVCMHEEDYGVLWKHDDGFSGRSDTRRSRRLVVSFWSVIGNYDYGFFWYLYQDGTIEFEAKLTGMMLSFSHAEGGEGKYATRVDTGVAAPYHQHLFNVRLDMTVDGLANTVEEVDVVSVPMGDDNPYGNAFVTEAVTLDSERDAARMANYDRSRTWRIVNRQAHNHVGNKVSYKLMPKNTPVMLAHPDSSVAKRAGFATKHLWVTQYSPDERYAAGNYPNQHLGGDGLPAYQAADRPLVDEDIVVWHTFGSTHIPRAEDWPVMPVEYAGFMLKPYNFFDRNPALDLPASSPGAEHSVETSDGPSGEACCH